MYTELSTLNQFKYDALMQQRIEEGKRQIKQNKAKVNDIAGKYNEKYKQAINEGTRKRQLLLAQHPGEDPDTVLAKHGQFLPSVHTPILNFLYFFVNEGYQGQNMENEFKREIQDKQFGALTEDVQISKEVGEMDDMEQFVYGNCTHKTFVTIKKLKRLANSSNNEQEAASAFIACKRLCDKYNLEYDKIPS